MTNYKIIDADGHVRESIAGLREFLEPRWQRRNLFPNDAWDRDLQMTRAMQWSIGIQREMVRRVLARVPFVKNFRDAPLEAGGWGATLVDLND